MATQIETNLSAEELLRRGDLARGFAGMMGGRRTKAGRDLAARGHAMTVAAIDKHFAFDVDALEMSDERLMAELAA